MPQHHCKPPRIQYVRAEPRGRRPRRSYPTPGEDAIRSQNYRDQYRAAGVNIDAGAALVEALKPLARSTARPGSDAGLGGFGAMFDLRATGYKDPVLVATTDGVGTKLKIAIAAGRHETIGIDLVAMCVNDLVVQGAEPLFFLDYFATGKLDVSVAHVILKGVAEACRATGCALIGGETAEMPGVYAPGDYDLAGFAVGAVERDRIIDGRAVRAGDAVLGLASSGLHSNAFSLVRRIVERAQLSYDAPAPFMAGRRLAEALLIPTRLYVKSCLAAAAAGGVKALAHITGGGLVENIPRVIPPDVTVEIDARAWTLPPVFRWLSETGGLSRGELARVFNCGLGMIAVVEPSRVDAITRILIDAGEIVHRVGRVVARPADGSGTLLINTESAWPG